mmetsp:Transcript_63093/g.133201  ORF Transcript_63093/g.133201 Transcript_63093/m.133201 type:complete len:375 (+) Transcript_63093:57-1181(+)
MSPPPHLVAEALASMAGRMGRHPRSSSSTSSASSGAGSATCSQYTVTLQREDRDNLGLQINLLWRSGMLRISEVKEVGLAKRWNNEHSAEEEIRRGDWLISVNGISEPPAAMFSQMQRPGQLEMVLSRTKPAGVASEGDALRPPPPREPQRIPVTISTAPDKKLGLDISVTSKSITVLDLKEGAIMEWNRSHAGQEVQVGDRIVFVDAAKPGEFLASLSKPGEKHIVFWRGPPHENPGVLPRASFERLATASVDTCMSGPSDVCGICLEEWNEEEEAIELQCGHHFHSSCGGKWLQNRSALCPLCQWAADCPTHSRQSWRASSCSTGPPDFEDDENFDVEYDDPTPIQTVRSSATNVKLPSVSAPRSMILCGVA